MSFRHIVLFRINDGVDDLAVDTIMKQLSALSAAPGVVSWRVARSLDERKGRVVIEDATFEDRAAFDVFKASAPHRTLGADMTSISDWVIGDYESD